eukprot:362948-Chlamydomonas_euryale.AAC.13
MHAWQQPACAVAALTAAPPSLPPIAAAAVLGSPLGVEIASIRGTPAASFARVGERNKYSSAHALSEATPPPGSLHCSLHRTAAAAAAAPCGAATEGLTLLAASVMPASTALMDAAARESTDVSNSSANMSSPSSATAGASAATGAESVVDAGGATDAEGVAGATGAAPTGIAPAVAASGACAKSKAAAVAAVWPTWPPLSPEATLDGPSRVSGRLAPMPWAAFASSSSSSRGLAYTSKSLCAGMCGEQRGHAW